MKTEDFFTQNCKITMLGKKFHMTHLFNTCEVRDGLKFLT